MFFPNTNQTALTGAIQNLLRTQGIVGGQATNPMLQPVAPNPGGVPDITRASVYQNNVNGIQQQGITPLMQPRADLIATLSPLVRFVYDQFGWPAEYLEPIQAPPRQPQLQGTAPTRTAQQPSAQAPVRTAQPVGNAPTRNTGVIAQPVANATPVVSQTVVPQPQVFDQTLAVLANLLRNRAGGIFPNIGF